VKQYPLGYQALVVLPTTCIYGYMCCKKPGKGVQIKIYKNHTKFRSAGKPRSALRSIQREWYTVCYTREVSDFRLVRYEGVVG
jgi:hypothetical protein